MKILERKPPGAWLFTAGAVAALGCTAPENEEGTAEAGSPTGVVETTTLDGSGSSSGGTTGPDTEGITTTTTSGSSGESDASSSTSEADGSTGGETIELCRMASSEEECHSLSDLCTWQPTYRVLELETCELAAVEYGCWARAQGGAPGCFGLWPEACSSTDAQPMYRVIDGALILLDLQGPCNYEPLVPEGEPAWNFCPHEEFERPPPVCYCLCGGPPGS